MIEAVSERRPVYIVEGEKDVLNIENAGFASTCNPGGAGKWLDDYGQYFKGATVVVIADKDQPGREHANGVAAKLAGKAASIKVIELPGARRSRNDAVFENDEMASAFVVDPTVTADEMQPGSAIPVLEPLLPDATTVATPINNSASIAGLSTFVSQGVVCSAPPMLRFTAAT